MKNLTLIVALISMLSLTSAIAEQMGHLDIDRSGSIEVWMKPKGHGLYETDSQKTSIPSCHAYDNPGSAKDHGIVENNRYYYYTACVAWKYNDCTGNGCDPDHIAGAGRGGMHLDHYTRFLLTSGPDQIYFDLPEIPLGSNNDLLYVYCHGKSCAENRDDSVQGVGYYFYDWTVPVLEANATTGGTYTGTIQVPVIGDYNEHTLGYLPVTVTMHIPANSCSLQSNVAQVDFGSYPVAATEPTGESFARKTVTFHIDCTGGVFGTLNAGGPISPYTTSGRMVFGDEKDWGLLITGSFGDKGKQIESAGSSYDQTLTLELKNWGSSPISPGAYNATETFTFTPD